METQSSPEYLGLKRVPGIVSLTVTIGGDDLFDGAPGI